MKFFNDIHGRRIRLTSERKEHIEFDHPEMSGQIDKMRDTLINPDMIVKSRTDDAVELFYQHYNTTPVTEKYLCVAVKILLNNMFILTAYFTDTIKRGIILWQKK